MSTRRSNIKKRERQKRRYAKRPKPVAKPVASFRGLITETLERLSPLAQAILDQQQT
jgi:hypothetical protein